MPDARTPLILDVDTGIDDALGLLYVCAAPEARNSLASPLWRAMSI